MERKLPRMWDSFRHVPFLSSFTMIMKVFRGFVSCQSKNILPERILSLLLLWDNDLVKKKKKRVFNSLLFFIGERSGAA